jgi:hypothetical protein
MAGSIPLPLRRSLIRSRLRATDQVRVTTVYMESPGHLLGRPAETCPYTLECSSDFEYAPTVLLEVTVEQVEAERKGRMGQPDVPVAKQESG